MRLEKWNGRNCLFGFEQDGGLNVLKKAYSDRLLPDNTKVFVGSSRFFGVVSGSVLRTYKMRENWNGWHDVGAYSLPDFTSIGTIVPADGSVGRHRNVLVID